LKTEHYKLPSVRVCQQKWLQMVSLNQRVACLTVSIGKQTVALYIDAPCSRRIFFVWTRCCMLYVYHITPTQRLLGDGYKLIYISIMTDKTKWQATT